MNIKGLFGANILPITPIKAGATERTIKSEASADRDANGQQAGGGEQQQKDPMNEEQIQKALEHLRNLPSVKEHNWQVELIFVENKKYVLVKDSNDVIIRRIPELDLWTLESEALQGKGQLLKKTA